MSYEVIARKWRPQNFDEVVFQDHISKTLQNSIQSSRISHAYLFSGPRGVGKTSMARILAKALNCIHGPTSNPCGVCNNCQEVKKGNAFDVIEIDGASNNGVDDIRELREKVNFAPVRSKYKVYIIDEVHMVTTQAFNALLKTLEEPPKHVVFIFATTEIHKIPDTILSRCQKFFFKNIPIENVIEHLRHIVSKEGFSISDKALYPIARSAQGSMRDAQSLLDQVISFSIPDADNEIKEISEDDALSILGIVPVQSFINQLQNIGAMDAVATMDEVERVVSVGADIARYVDGFLEIIRTLRLVQNKVSIKELLGLSNEEIDLLNTIAGTFSEMELRNLFKVMNEVQKDLRYSNNERINLEMALLDMITLKRGPSLASIIKKLEESQGGAPIKSNAAMSSGIVEKKQQPAEKKNESKKSIAKKETTSSVKGDISGKWLSFLQSIQNERQYLHFVLKPSSIEYNNNSLSIRYPSDADHTYYSKILDKDNIAFIEKKMSELVGDTVNVQVGVYQADNNVKAPQSNEKNDDSNVDDKARIENDPDDVDMVPPPDAEMLKKPEVEGFEKEDPTIEKIKSAFHGQIIEKGEG